MTDPGNIRPVARIVCIDIELAFIGFLIAKSDSEDRLFVIQRTNRLHIDGSTDRLCGERRVRCLIDGGAGNQLRGELVVLDRTVIVRGDKLTAIQRSGREIRRQAADRDLVGTTVETLRGQAWQTCQRFTDRCIGQLADVLSRNGLDDRRRITFRGDGVRQALAVTGGYYLFDNLTIVLRHGGSRKNHRARQGSSDGQRYRRPSDIHAKSCFVRSRMRFLALFVDHCGIPPAGPNN